MNKYITEIINLNNYCIIDIETSGLDETESEIIEIALVKVRDRTIVDTYTSLIKPKENLSNKVENITKISNEQLQNAPSIYTVSPKVHEFVGNDILISHNATFTIKFIHKYMPTIDNEVIDTLELSRKLIPKLQSYRLSNLCSEIGIENFKKDSSTLNYSYITMHLFEYLKQQLFKLGGGADAK